MKINHLLASFILALIVFVSSLPVVAVDPVAVDPVAVGPKAEESSAAVVSGMRLAGAASPEFPLEKMSLEMQHEILLRLSPKDVGRLARTCRPLRGSVNRLRAHCQKIYQVHVRAGVREGLRAHESNPAGYGLRLFVSRAEVEARMPPQKLRQVSPAYKEEVWKEEVSFWREHLSFDIFAATPNNPIYEIADRMADYQKANMADVMLAAMYSAEAPPSYLEKVAIHHLFSAYTVFHKEESLAEWQQQLSPSKKERLQQFIAETYVEFDPGRVPAVRPDQKLVVKCRQLDEDPNIAALNGILQPDQPQPEMVLDFDGRDQIAGLRNQHLPIQLTKLAVINSGGAITKIEDFFLYYCQSLKTLTLSLPKAEQVGDFFLSDCQSLKTLTLSLLQVTWIGDEFLSGCLSLKVLTLILPQVTQAGHTNFLSECQSLETLTLSLPQLTEAGYRFLSNNRSFKTLTLSLPQLMQVGDYFLDGCEHLGTVDLSSLLKLEEVDIAGFMEGMTKLEHVLIDARQEEFFNELLKDKPDLLSKFMIA